MQSSVSYDVMLDSKRVKAFVNWLLGCDFA